MTGTIFAKLKDVKTVMQSCMQNLHFASQLHLTAKEAGNIMPIDIENEMIGRFDGCLNLNGTFDDISTPFSYETTKNINVQVHWANKNMLLVAVHSRKQPKNFFLGTGL
jgi:hypothetical protein